MDLKKIDKTSYALILLIGIAFGSILFLVTNSEQSKDDSIIDKPTIKDTAHIDLTIKNVVRAEK
ncbi:MAG: hypothetical protein IS860_06955 [Nitrosopumilus sp.]|nr:hypothetical protein [Nitrosopumilus sp.]